MSLTALFVLCRFAHFASLMQIFGLSVFCSLLAPAGFSGILLQRNQILMMWSGVVAAITSVGMLAIQAALMGNGWSDGLNLNVWLPVCNLLVFLCSLGLLLTYGSSA